MIRKISAPLPTRRTEYRRVFFILPRTVIDRSTDRLVRVWGSGMLGRWSRSERAWHYRSISE